MSNHEQLPTPSIESIAGKYVDIQIVDPMHMRTFLESVQGHKGLYYGTQDDLPEPLVSASLDYWNNRGDKIGITSSVDFSSEIIGDQSEVA